MYRDPYTEGHIQGCTDREAGFEYAPEDDDPAYLAGYEDGWDEAGEDGPW